MQRPLSWDGIFNTRDLGGIPTVDGGCTQVGRMVRSDALDHLTSAGWAALHDYGVRTIVDLRNSEERTPDLSPRPVDVDTLHVPLDADVFADMQRHGQDPGFWDGWGPDRQLGTPLYFRAHVQRYPQASAAVLVALARARPGGVLFHCVIGRDRTGMIAILLLMLAGAALDAIVDDYEQSAANLPPLFARLGRTFDGDRIDALLRRAGTTARQTIDHFVHGWDVAAHLRLQPDDVAALRRRLLEP